MLLGTASYMIHRQRQSMLHTVDTLVLRTMIHIRPPDILHKRNQSNIRDKNSDSQQSLDQRNQKRGIGKAPEESCHSNRKHHEYRDTQHDGKDHGKCHHKMLQLLLRHVTFQEVGF